MQEQMRDQSCATDASSLISLISLVCPLLPSLSLFPPVTLCSPSLALWFACQAVCVRSEFDFHPPSPLTLTPASVSPDPLAFPGRECDRERALRTTCNQSTCLCLCSCVPFWREMSFMLQASRAAVRLLFSRMRDACLLCRESALLPTTIHPFPSSLSLPSCRWACEFALSLDSDHSTRVGLPPGL